MKLCTEPWTSMTIDTDGNIKSCLCGDWNTVGTIGNLLHDDLESIYNSAKLERFKSKILNEDYSMCTKVCPWRDHISDKDPSVIAEQKIPNKILLAIDQNCNLSCASCRTHNVFSTEINNNASIILDKIYNFYQGKKVEIQFDGAGDLFASRAYHIFLQKKFHENFRFHIITNGNLLTKQTSIVDNIKDNIISIDVSLDAANPDTYKKTRGGVFELVKNGIEMCVAKGIKVNLSFVVQSKNYKELKSCWDLAVKLGCHSVMFHMVRRWDHIDDKWWMENSVEHLPKSHRQELFQQLSFLKNTKKIVTKDSIPAYMTGDLYNFQP